MRHECHFIRGASVILAHEGISQYLGVSRTRGLIRNIRVLAVLSDSPTESSRIMASRTTEPKCISNEADLAVRKLEHGDVVDVETALAGSKRGQDRSDGRKSGHFRCVQGGHPGTGKPVRIRARPGFKRGIMQSHMHWHLGG